MVLAKQCQKALGVLIFIFCFLGASPVSAITLDFVPADQTVNLGDQTNVDVMVSDPSGNLIGAFDFFINYDASILALIDVVFGSALGGPLDSLQDEFESPPGNVNVVELSFIPDLTTLQDGTSDLLLFSMEFNTVALGTGSLGFSENILGIAGGFLGDDLGAPIALDAVGTGTITVVPRQVSEPTTVGLMGLALIAFLGSGFRHRRTLTD